MEQKKILWVVLSVSVFVLLIFGIALFLYAPSRNENIAESGGEVIPYDEAGSSETSVDPDMWVRKPDAVSELDTTAAPASGNITNLIIVSGDSTPAERKSNAGDLDVSSLTADKGGVNSMAELPKELANQIGIETAADAEKQKDMTVNTEKMPRKQAAAKRMTIRKAEKLAESVHASKKRPHIIKRDKAMQKKNQTETLYWVQTASLASRINAEQARDMLAARHMKAEVFTRQTASGVRHRVRVGPFTNNTEARYWLKGITGLKGFERSYVTEELVKK